MPPPITWAELLSASRKRLPEPEYPRFEAEELLAHAAGRPRSWFLSRRGEAADPDAAAAFTRLVERRAAGEPLQYLLGEWEFLGRTFRVDPRALIPRHETEEIVVAARTAAPDARRILEAGTGSGILAVSLAIERPEASVVAVDVSPAALFLTRENARRFGVEERVHLIGSNWLSALRTGSGSRFEIAVSNPPYVPLVEAPHLERTVSDHEPSVAIFGGNDGLDPLRVLLAQLPPLLTSGAPFIFEIGYAQAAAVTGLVEQSGAFRLEDVRLDPAGIPRTVVAVRG